MLKQQKIVDVHFLSSLPPLYMSMFWITNPSTPKALILNNVLNYEYHLPIAYSSWRLCRYRKWSYLRVMWMLEMKASFLMSHIGALTWYDINCYSLNFLSEIRTHVRWIRVFYSFLPLIHPIHPYWIWWIGACWITSVPLIHPIHFWRHTPYRFMITSCQMFFILFFHLTYKFKGFALD